MKKIAVTLILSLICFNLFAQEPTSKERERKNEIGMEVLDLIDGSFHFSYERLVWRNFSFVLGAAYKTEDGLVKLSGIDREKIKTNDIAYFRNNFNSIVSYIIGFYFFSIDT